MAQTQNKFEHIPLQIETYMRVPCDAVRSAKIACANAQTPQKNDRVFDLPIDAGAHTMSSDMRHEMLMTCDYLNGTIKLAPCVCVVSVAV